MKALKIIIVFFVSWFFGIWLIISWEEYRVKWEENNAIMALQIIWYFLWVIGSIVLIVLPFIFVAWVDKFK